MLDDIPVATWAVFSGQGTNVSLLLAVLAFDKKQYFKKILSNLLLTCNHGIYVTTCVKVYLLS